MKLIASFACLLGTLISCNSKDKSYTPTNFTNDRNSKLDSFVKNIYAVSTAPGLAIAIIKDDSVYYKTLGYSSLKNKTTLQDSTPLFMGNLSETMVSFILLKLAEQNKINLDSSVMKYLPYFKLGGPSDKITIKNLMTHSSGVPIHGAAWDSPNHDRLALSVTTKSIGMQPPIAPPSTAINRSAYNYDILADLIRQQTKPSFESYTKSIFESLQLFQTSFDKKQLMREVAMPHKVTNWLSYKVEETSDEYPYNGEHAGSIGLHSSIKDMSDWMFALLHHGKLNNREFISSSSLDTLLSPQYKTNLENSFIGLGWEMTKADGRLYLKKNHQLGGFTADLTLIPSQKIGILIFANISDDFDSDALSTNIYSFLMGVDFPQIKEPIYLAMGKEADRTGSLESAFSLYKRNVNSPKYDTSVQTTSKLGVNLLYKNNSPDKAISVFQFIADNNPQSNYAKLNLAETYLLKGNRVEAKRIINTIQISPTDDTEIVARVKYIQSILRQK